MSGQAHKGDSYSQSQSPHPHREGRCSPLGAFDCGSSAGAGDLRLRAACSAADGIALNPYQTVDDASLWRLPPSGQTSGMRIQDAVSGSWQIGVGAPLYWFGLSAEDQDPYSLEPGDKDRLRKKLQQKLGLLRL